MQYNIQEMVQMHFFYGRANGNKYLAREMYANAFPNRRIPDRRTFQAIHTRLFDNGTVYYMQRHNTGRNRYVRTIETEERILNLAQENPSLSISALGGVSKSVVWRIFHENMMYPYRLQRNQGLLEADYPRRLRFCQWFLQQLLIEPIFLFKMFYSLMKQTSHGMEYSISIMNTFRVTQIHMQFGSLDISINFLLTFGLAFFKINW